MPTVKLVHRIDKMRKDGTAPIWLRVTANRKSRFRSTKIFVEPKHWNDKRCEVRKGHELAEAINAKLRDMLLSVQREALQTESPDDVLDSLTGSKGSVIRFFDGYIDELDEAGKFWEWKKYRVTRGKVVTCLGNDLDWRSFDRSSLRRFERCLREDYGNGPNTTRKELQRLRRVVRRAIRDNVIKPEHDPFVSFDSPRAQKPNRRKLSIDEIQLLESADVSSDSGVVVARDAFLFAFYGAGIRFSDTCLLRRDNLRGDRLEYRMMKTAHLLSLPLPPFACKLFAKYASMGGSFVFPLLKEGDDADPVRLRRKISSRNVIVNRDLKRLAQIAGLEPDGLSFHVARHSWTTYARSQGGDLYAISKSLGHGGLQTTEQYLQSFDQEAVDKLADKVWGGE